jgi:ribose-phosphate pyrophosphokinase
MKKIMFAVNDDDALARSVLAALGPEPGLAEIRRFPDGESYVRVVSEVGGKHAIIFCTLDHPDHKFMPLYFLARTLRELGAAKITLVAPYLSYMRQDARFKQGEAISSEYFAQLLGSFLHEIITVDPHLHRRNKMSELYTIETCVVHTASLIADYIKGQVSAPVLIGPDSESEQWVAEVANKAGAPYLIFRKERHGDEQVEISAPDLLPYRLHTPVLIDDIISTGHTMMETIAHLRSQDLQSAVCIAVHGIFARNAYEELRNSGAGRIVTCNTIAHPSNKLDVTELIVSALTNDK